VLLHVLDRPDVTGVLNVGTGIGTSLRDLARTMEHVTGMPVSLNAVAMHRRAVSANVLDPGLLRRTLGHGPTTPLPEGLSMMWRALRG
jgi:nucleoside-diphosphate-sugar epimerase